MFQSILVAVDGSGVHATVADQVYELVDGQVGLGLDVAQLTR